MQRCVEGLTTMAELKALLQLDVFLELSGPVLKGLIGEAR